jgi:replicative DNA helicase
MERANMPSALEAEDILLGAIMQDSSLYDSVIGYINEDVLFKQESKIVWNKINNMMRLGNQVDMVTISSSLTEGEKSAGVNAYYLTGLFEYSVIPEKAKIYARAIYEKYLLRLIIDKSTKIQTLAQDNQAKTYDVLSDTHSLIGELIEIKPGEVFNINSEMDLAMKSISQGEGSLIKTGFEGLDKLSGGMTRGEITIVGGRPGHGKTTFTINLIKRLIESNKKIILFNREMTNAEMLKKLIALESGRLSYGMIRRGTLDMEGWAELERTKKAIINKYSEGNFAMFDNLKDFSSSASEVKKFKPDVIIDDYIQLIKPENPNEQRRLQLESIVNNYKWLSKSSKACTILVSQLNRALESRLNQRPMLSDLAESGAIEQVAENVWFVFYDYKVNHARSKLGANAIELIGSKVRYGNSGDVAFGFDGDKVKLYNTIEEFKEARRNV